MTTLLDANVVIALLDDAHEHHQAARRWFLDAGGQFATCPITQGAIIRYTLRRGRSAASSVRTVRSLTGHKRHRFWVDDIQYPLVRLDGVVGHRQVTDAYLAALARRHNGRLLTFDRALVELHSDVADLLPVESSAS
jgi:toxin-antitoxin system PIN domain toxin